MATYSTIKGFQVQSLATDPYEAAVEAGTWASGGTLNTGRAYGQGFGTQTAAVYAGGYSGSLGAATEKYNGASWSANPNPMTDGRQYGGSCGIETAGLVFGGENPSQTDNSEEFDGSTWVEGSNMNNSSAKMAGAGIQTAAISMSGLSPDKLQTEEYNGASWSNSPDLNAGHADAFGAGTSTAALCGGGEQPTVVATVEEWNGTSWTEVGDLNTARYGIRGTGSVTTALAFMGVNPPSSFHGNTEYYNGTAWTELADLATARQGGGTASNASTTGATALAIGGYYPGPTYSNLTEEWSVPSTVSIAQEGDVWYNTASNVLKGYKAVVGTGTWSSGGSLNYGRSQLGGTGSQTAALAFFGSKPGVYPSGATKYVEEYNGTGWTNLSDANSERYSGGSIGQTTTDAGYAGGYGAPPPPLQSTLTEIWNGSSWTESGDLQSGRQGFFGGAGTTTAGLVAGSGPADGATEVFNGTSWTEVNNLVTARQYAPVCGLTSTAAMCVGGYGIPAASPYSNGPGSRVGLTEIWNGTSWTQSANTLVLGRIEAGLSGTTSLSVIAGGSTGDPAPPTVNTASAETWDGTSWTSVAAMGDAVVSAGSSRTGGSTSAILFGGSPGDVATSEEWTVPDTTYGIKTFTAS